MASLKFLGKTAFHVLLQRVSTSFQKQHASLPLFLQRCSMKRRPLRSILIAQRRGSHGVQQSFQDVDLKDVSGVYGVNQRSLKRNILDALQAICIEHYEILFNIPLPGDSKVITLCSSWGIALTHLGKLLRLKTTAENTSTLAILRVISRRSLSHKCIQSHMSPHSGSTKWRGSI